MRFKCFGDVCDLIKVVMLKDNDGQLACVAGNTDVYWWA